MAVIGIVIALVIVGIIIAGVVYMKHKKNNAEEIEMKEQKVIDEEFNSTQHDLKNNQDSFMHKPKMA